MRILSGDPMKLGLWKLGMLLWSDIGGARSGVGDSEDLEKQRGPTFTEKGRLGLGESLRGTEFGRFLFGAGGVPDACREIELRFNGALDMTERDLERGRDMFNGLVAGDKIVVKMLKKREGGAHDGFALIGGGEVEEVKRQPSLKCRNFSVVSCVVLDHFGEEFREQVTMKANNILVAVYVISGMDVRTFTWSVTFLREGAWGEDGEVVIGRIEKMYGKKAHEFKVA